MAEFIYLRKKCPTNYPIGEYYSNSNFAFIREAALQINKTFPKGKLILVVRGHSGSILAGGIAYILTKKHREVLISVSRKDHEYTHGSNLEGIECILSDNTHVIVVDDFVETGDTIETIVDELSERVNNRRVFDMLCVGNFWDKDEIGHIRLLSIFTRFEYVLCNKYEE